MRRLLKASSFGQQHCFVGQILPKLNLTRKCWPASINCDGLLGNELKSRVSPAVIFFLPHFQMQKQIFLVNWWLIKSSKMQMQKKTNPQFSLTLCLYASGWEYNFDKINTLNLDTPYDYNSVMQYHRFEEIRLPDTVHSDNHQQILQLFGRTTLCCYVQKDLFLLIPDL